MRPHSANLILRNCWRVRAVEATIFNRLQELAQTSEERIFLKLKNRLWRRSFRTLRVLKRDKLHFPDWETQ